MLSVPCDMQVLLNPEQRWVTIGQGMDGDVIVVRCSEGTLGIMMKYWDAVRYMSESGPLLMPYDLEEWRKPSAERDGFLHVEIGFHEWMEGSMLLADDLVTTPHDICKYVLMKLPIRNGSIQYDRVSPKRVFA